MANNYTNFLKNSLVFGAVGLTALVSGCGVNENSSNGGKSKNGNYEFSNFGKFETESNFSESRMELGDMDGDGDLDVVIFDTKSDKVFIYENKIPQKNLAEEK